MAITHGRGDIAALARVFRTNRTAELRERERMRAGGWRPDEGPEKLDLLVYPVGWNEAGHPVVYEAKSIVEYREKDIVVTARSVKGCEMRARWHIACAMREDGATGPEGREIARAAVVTMTLLDRRPSVGGEVVT